MKQCKLRVYASATRRPTRHCEILQDGRFDELLPNQSLNLRSAFRWFFVENGDVNESYQAGNNQPATLQFISS